MSTGFQSKIFHEREIMQSIFYCVLSDNIKVNVIWIVEFLSVMQIADEILCDLILTCARDDDVKILKSPIQFYSKRMSIGSRLK